MIAILKNIKINPLIAGGPGTDLVPRDDNN